MLKRVVTVCVAIVVVGSLTALAGDSGSGNGHFTDFYSDMKVTTMPDGSMVQVFHYTNMTLSEDPDHPSANTAHECIGEMRITAAGAVSSGSGMCSKKATDGHGYSYWWEVEKAATPDCPVMCGVWSYYGGYGRFENLQGEGTWEVETEFEVIGNLRPSWETTEGTVIAESALRPADDQIKEALHAFVGEIMQVPPRYSAVRVQGERAYALARGGEEVELAARPLWVESLIMTGQPDADHAEFELVCGKGGYVRSIARDLGRALGCLGHVTALRRIWSGPFEAAQGVTLDEVKALAGTPELDARLLPLEAGLADLPQVRAPAERTAWVTPSTAPSASCAGSW